VQPPLREKLRLHLVLPNGEFLTLPAEVVHRVLSGPRVGVGLQFVDLKPNTFEAIEALLAQPVRRPRVLVVDDEAIWRSTLVRVLHSLDADVTLAKDGREGLVQLIDHYFELDLVILDLHMPHLDGRGLIDRVRRLGGDAAFKIFLFSAASRPELEALGEPGLATGVFSKLDPLDVLAAHLARELGRSWPPKQSAIAA
jgi:CheY-like chemotaxis protein